ncbi:MAG: virulence RhuM family protein [Odoribacter sp.]|nr:virulence RhuM family protein [Odoribacter sp.]
MQDEGARKVERDIAYYNLDMIISAGYRVNSHRGVQFRQWATQVLKEYMIKGFVLNDKLLKNAVQGNYFDELLSRIRNIRISEKVFYRKVLEIYALSIDYDPSDLGHAMVLQNGAEQDTLFCSQSYRR